MKNINEVVVEIIKNKAFNAEDFARNICENIYNGMGSCKDDCPFCVRGFYTNCAKDAFLEMAEKMKDMNMDFVKTKED